MESESSQSSHQAFWLGQPGRGYPEPKAHSRHSENTCQMNEFTDNRNTGGGAGLLGERVDELSFGEIQ